MKKILLITVLALLGAGKAQAADERARRDINRVPALLAVDETTGEIRKIKVTADGFVLTVSTIPGGVSAAATLVDQGAAGGSAWLVDGSGVVQPISAASLPLPAGAATSANQTTGNSSLSSIDGKLPSQGAGVTAASIPVNIASDQTVPISAASLPLPTGAATAANQSTGNSSLSTIEGDTTSIDGKTPALGQAAMAASVPVAIASDQSAIPVSGTLSVQGSTVSVQIVEGETMPVDDAGGSLTIDAVSLPLPAGAATSANQSTGNSSLSTIAGDTTSIDGKTPSLGQAAMAASVPVAIASDQTPISVTGSTVSVQIMEGQTIPITASSLPLPAGAATSANQTTGNSSLSTIAGDTTSLDAKVPSQGAAVIAASLPVNIASDQTVPVSAVSLPLPSGAATSANQSTGNSSLSTIAGDTTSIDGKTPSLGQAAMAASVPVAIASDQSVLPIDSSGNDTPTQSCTNITTAAEVLAASATRESTLICNEGPEIARCGSGSVTTLIGQRLLVDQCYTLDAFRPFRGAASCVSVGGPSTKICVAVSN